MKRGLIIAGVIVVILLAGIGGAYLWLSRPVDLKAFEEPGPTAAVKQQNSDVQTRMLSEGIVSALVDIEPERAYVAYDAPAPEEGEELDVEELQMVVLYSLESTAPESPRAVVVMFIDGAAKHVWKADLTALRAIPDTDDGTALEAYLATIERTEL